MVIHRMQGLSQYPATCKDRGGLEPALSAAIEASVCLVDRDALGGICEERFGTKENVLLGRAESGKTRPEVGNGS